MASVLLVILLGNALYLLQIRNNDPIIYSSGLGTAARGILAGKHTIDPNDGWTAQALGRLAAESWAHGHVPLWNTFEGLGQPLAGEMQSAALFVPFIFLQLLPNGVFLMHVALELVAGLSTLGFLRTLKLSWVAAVCGGCLFGLNGTFAVMTNAPFNPIAFLPMALWGVELLIGAARSGRRPRAGLWFTALAIAFMLFAGFPETALLEGVFVALWLLVRLIAIPGHRRSALVWGAVSALAGLAIAAPILVCFKDFLGFGYLAYHGDAVNSLSYPLRQVSSLLLPFGSGGPGNPVFGLQAGYLTLPAAFMAIIGFAGQRARSVKILLAAILAVLLLNMFGFEPVKVVLDATPGLRSILIYKYGLALIEFAVVILAAFGVDDLLHSRVRRRSAIVALVLVAGYLLVNLGYLHHEGLLKNWSWSAIVIGWTVLGLIVLGLVTLRSGVAGRAAVLSAIAMVVVVADCAGTYVVPQLAASSRTSVDLGSVRYLQQHLGASRFYTLGPIQPNYGSYWQIAQLNANDLPVPQKYATFVMGTLRPAKGTSTRAQVADQFAAYQLVPFDPDISQQQELLTAYGQRQSAFRQAAVRYVVTAPGVASTKQAARYGLRLVYQDSKTNIFEDPRADSLYSTSGADCRILAQAPSSVRLDCTRPATLVRRSLTAPGWTATTDGRSLSLSATPNRLYQQVTVPAGTSTVTFDYRPAFFETATIASLVVVVVMVVDVAVVILLRRRRATDVRV
ncbi:hypothetical protein [Rudaeicoccus suwonensis]|uniref:hypothetical protein n=1 Tax=Rudaeicoccus suwonensis TaxID=657409 RepID=UPI00119F3442|nr:hypothetical protein [Rudaeicoccus suwonensis]